MQPQKKAYVKKEKNQEKQHSKDTTDTRLPTLSEQLEKLADIIIDIYYEIENAPNKEASS